MWGWPALLGIPWLAAASPVCASVVPWPPPLCGSLFPNPSLPIRLPVLGWRVHLSSAGTHLHLITSAKTLFPTKVTFTGLGLPPIFLGTPSHPGQVVLQQRALCAGLSALTHSTSRVCVLHPWGCALGGSQSRQGEHCPAAQNEETLTPYSPQYFLPR